MQIAGAPGVGCGAKQPMYTLVRVHPACCLIAPPLAHMCNMRVSLYVGDPIAGQEFLALTVSLWPLQRPMALLCLLRKCLPWIIYTAQFDQSGKT